MQICLYESNSSTNPVMQVSCCTRKSTLQTRLCRSGCTKRPDLYTLLLKPVEYIVCMQQHLTLICPQTENLNSELLNGKTEQDWVAFVFSPDYKQEKPNMQMAKLYYRRVLKIQSLVVDSCSGVSHSLSKQHSQIQVLSWVTFKSR